MRNIYLILVTFSIFVFTGCVPYQNISKESYYSNFYKKHPKSILILSAVNNTSASGILNNYRATLTKLFTERGYYVFPVHLVDSFFKSENLFESELIRNIPVSKLKEVFNTDSILYIDIISWDTDYLVLASSVDVTIYYKLIDTSNEEIIWDVVTLGKSGTSGQGGLIGALIESALNTTVSYSELAYYANHAATLNLPFGKYHKKFLLDKKELTSFSEHHDPLIRLFHNFKIVNNQLIVPNTFIKNNTHFFDNKVSKGSMKMVYPSIGGHAINNFSYVWHSEFEDYYYLNKNNLRHRFFSYDNNKPFLIAENKKVFIYTDKNGKIPYNEKEEKYIDFETEKENTRYTYSFNIEKIVDLEKR